MSRSNETSGVELVVVGVFAFCLAVVAWLIKLSMLNGKQHWKLRLA